MKIQIRDGNADVSDALRVRVEHRLRFALGRFGARIQSVIVRFTDVGADKHCSIEVRLGSVQVDDVDVDFSAALDNASARVSRAVARALEREPTNDGSKD